MDAETLTQTLHDHTLSGLTITNVSIVVVGAAPLVAVVPSFGAILTPCLCNSLGQAAESQ